jgi:hypothetical protein
LHCDLVFSFFLFWICERTMDPFQN